MLNSSNVPSDKTIFLIQGGSLESLSQAHNNEIAQDEIQ